MVNAQSFLEVSDAANSSLADDTEDTAGASDFCWRAETSRNRDLREIASVVEMAIQLGWTPIPMRVNPKEQGQSTRSRHRQRRPLQIGRQFLSVCMSPRPLQKESARSMTLIVPHSTFS